MTTSAQMYINGQAESGSFAAALGSVGSDGTLSQTLQTTAGQQYTLSFWLANNGSSPDDFTAKWNGATVLALTSAPCAKLHRVYLHRYGDGQYVDS